MVREVGGFAAVVERLDNVGDHLGIFGGNGGVDIADQSVPVGADGSFLVVVEHSIELAGIVGPHGKIPFHPGLKLLEIVHAQKPTKAGDGCVGSITQVCDLAEGQPLQLGVIPQQCHCYVVVCVPFRRRAHIAEQTVQQGAHHFHIIHPYSPPCTICSNQIYCNTPVSILSNSNFPGMQAVKSSMTTGRQNPDSALQYPSSKG